MNVLTGILCDRFWGEGLRGQVCEVARLTGSIYYCRRISGHLGTFRRTAGKWISDYYSSVFSCFWETTTTGRNVLEVCCSIRLSYGRVLGARGNGCSLRVPPRAWRFEVGWPFYQLRGDLCTGHRRAGTYSLTRRLALGCSNSPWKQAFPRFLRFLCCTFRRMPRY